MSKKEKGFQDMVIALFTKQGGHAVNVEPGITNPGMPDVNWCLQGIEGNVELKFGYDHGAAPLIRPNQVVWFRERIKAGGYPMFGYFLESEKYTDEVYVFQGRHFEALTKAKDVEDLFDIPNLRIMNPEDFVSGLISEMSSWDDEVTPRIQLV